MNVLQLKEWLNTLPADYDDFEACTLTHSGVFPKNMKRAVIDRKQGALIFNPMGTHFSDEQYNEMDIQERLQP